MQLGRRRGTIRTYSPNKVKADKNGSKRRALTAAATKVTRGEGDKMRRLIQPWQAQAFYYYDRLGEIKYAASFYARGLAPLELYAGEVIVGKDGRPEIKPTENPEAIALLSRIQDPGGGRSGMLGNYGRLKFITGECYLFVTKGDDDLEQWEVLSTDELRVTGNGTYVRYKAPSLPAEEYREPEEDEWNPENTQQGIPYRLWTKHPRYSWLADSTMQGVLDLCEELILLRQSVRARARSRLAGPGWLLIPEELSPAQLEPSPDEDPEEDPFVADLTEAMTAGLTDEGSPSTQVPLISRVSGEYIDKVRHIQIVDPMQLYPETGLRRECVEGIAIGLDLPPEILLGLADANHWTAWAIDEQTWKSHLMPMAQQFCDDLTSAYLRPSLRDGGMAAEEAARYVIAYDATAVINHPDRSRDAKDLHDAGVLSDSALREACGFDENDAPSEEERLVWLAVKARDPGFALSGIPTRITSEAAALEEEAGVTPGGKSSADAVKEPPVEPSQETPADQNEREGLGASGNGGGAGLYRIVGAADFALLRAREVAGNRVKSFAKRDREIQKEIEGVPARSICALLGKEKVAALGCPPDRELVAGARDLILDALRLFGLNDKAVCERIADLVEQHAARTLYSEKPAMMPAQFRNYVAGADVALSAAGRRR